VKAQIEVGIVGQYTIIKAGDQVYRLHHSEQGKVITVQVTDFQDEGDSPDATKPDKPWEPLLPASLKKGARSHLAKTLRSDEQDMEVFKNDLYTVIRTRMRAIEGDTDTPLLIHLSIRRNDRSPARDWRHFQKIKNELAGEDAEAVELFPSESRLIDAANQYHLWCVPPGEQFAFGWFDGRLTTSNPPMGAQRPFVDGEEETLEKVRETLEKAQARANEIAQQDPAANDAAASPEEDNNSE
jgi:hypothetical protein